MTRWSLKEISEKVLVALFLGLLFLKDFIGMSVPSLAFMGTWILIILVADRSISAAFTLSSVIFFASTLSITIPMAVYVAITFLRRGMDFKLNKAIVISAICILFELAQVFIIYNDELRPFVNTALVILLVAVVVTELYESFVSPKIILYYYLAFYTFFAFDMVIATCRYLGSFTAIISSNFRLGVADNESAEAFDGILAINANGLALLSIIAIAVSTLLLIKKHINPIIGSVMIVFSGLIGFLTVSKTFLLVLIGFAFLLLISNAIKNQVKIYKPIGLLAGFLVAGYFITKQQFFINLWARFSEGDLTTGRIEIALDYIDKMSHSILHIFFGTGFQNILEKLDMVHAVHNATIEIYVCKGLVGLVLYAVFFISLFQMGNRFLNQNSKTKYKLENFIPFIVYLVFVQSLQFFTINYIYALIAICFAMAVTTNKECKV
jgi:hypothetical protein